MKRGKNVKITTPIIKIEHIIKIVETKKIIYTSYQIRLKTMKKEKT